MAGAFDWGSDKKSGVSSGKEGKLPKHIERMNAGTSPPEAKGSVMKGSKSMSDSGLPWGGEPAEKKKAYSSGPPTGKNSVTSRTGERKGSVGTLPQVSKAAHVGHTMPIKSKSMGMKKK